MVVARNTDSSPSKERKRRTPRGATELNKLAVYRSRDILLELHVNKRGQLIGDNAATFKSYCGVLVRRNISIAHPNWNQVSEELKEKLWEAIKLIYNVEIVWTKKKFLSACSKCWRTFKNVLTVKHILPHLHQQEILRKPPATYKFIEQGPWEIFVKDRLSRQFMAIRDKQMAIRAKHLYPHRISRKGYAKLELEIQKKEGTTTDINRAVLWKSARADEFGNFNNMVIKDKAEKIDELSERKDKGLLTTIGKKDILTLALETPEHTGRVRGMGQHVTPSMYFPPPPTRQAQDEEMDRMRNEVYELSAKYKNVMKILLKQNPDKISPNSILEVDIEAESDENVENVLGDMHGVVDELQNPASDVFGPVSSATSLQEEKTIQLASGTIDNIVAKGIILESDDPNATVHGVSLSIQNVRVSITTVIKADAMLPIPVGDELVLVGDAIGSFVAWPKKLVLSSDFISKQDELPKPQPPTRPSPQKMVYTLIMFIENSMEESTPLHMQMDNGVVSDDSYDIYVPKEDLLQFCTLEPISVQILVVYMRFRDFKLKSSSIENLYLLVEPGVVSAVRTERRRATDLAVRMEKCKDNQLVVFPYNIDYHWMLVVIDLFDRIVYFFDPLGHQQPNDLVSFVTIAYRVWCCGRGEKSRTLSWSCVKCPVQPNHTECGYFVMKYMKDLFELPRTSIKNMFDGKESYSMKDVNEMREEFAKYILDFI